RSNERRITQGRIVTEESEYAADYAALVDEPAYRIKRLITPDPRGIQKTAVHNEQRYLEQARFPVQRQQPGAIRDTSAGSKTHSVGVSDRAVVGQPAILPINPGLRAPPQVMLPPSQRLFSKHAAQHL